MFDDLLESTLGAPFSAEERAELRRRIEDWDMRHPQAQPSERVTAWIDLAYALQSERGAGPSVRGG